MSDSLMKKEIKTVMGNEKAKWRTVNDEKEMCYGEAGFTGNDQRRLVCDGTIANQRRLFSL